MSPPPRSEVWREEVRGGYPDPRLAALRDRLYDRAYAPGTPAGALSTEWGSALGLPPGIPIAMGGFDAHYGAIGSGIRTGTFVKIIGTSKDEIHRRVRSSLDLVGLRDFADAVPTELSGGQQQR